MCYKKDKFFFSFFFDVMKYVHIFPSQIGNFEYDHRFAFSSQMKNIKSCMEVRLQKRIRFDIFEVA